ncbi:protein kinase [Streptomyces sp. NPDC005648]|uniref:protein kinase domain-containing protein n=1 Tax=Streptomyces sp. NPDC005648 TaxID=3157044 RepID=UPI0033A928AB
MSQHRPVPPDSAPDQAAALRQSGAAPLHSGDPRRIGPYVPLALLGSGGMGRVYLARPAGGGPGLVAAKVIRPEYADDPGFRRRFEREASVHDLVRTPHTPRLCGTGFDDRLLWMATEYLPGLDLADAVREDGALATGAVWRLVAELGRALADLAAAGIVHRDLKPSNVLLSVRGAYVIDFGLSKAVDASALTGTGNRVGTPAYMSPEHLRTGTCGPESDVFSLAATLVYAATGSAPFGDGTGVDVMHRVAFEEPNAELLATVAAADPDLAALLSACLAKEPEQRPTPRELVGTASPRARATEWPEPLANRVLTRQRAYETLERLPADAPRLRSTDAEPDAGPEVEPTPGTPPDDRPADFRPAGSGPVDGRPAGSGPVDDRPAGSRPVGAPAPPAEHPNDPAPAAPAAALPLETPHGLPAAPHDGPPVDPANAPDRLPEAAARTHTRDRARRKPLLVVAVGVVLCATAAGILALSRPDHYGSDASPGSGTTRDDSLPGVAVSAISGGSGSASTSGKSVDGAAGPDTSPTSSVAAGPSASGVGATGGAGSPGAGTPVTGPSASSGTTEPSTEVSSEPATPPWISDCTYYSGNGRTVEGDSGKRVLQVQCMLTKRGYDVGGTGVDGEFGPGTTAAVESFQSDKGLAADGVVRKDTWTALRETD